MSRSGPGGSVQKAFRSLVDRLRVSGMPFGTGVLPLMVSSSSHDRAVFRRAGGRRARAGFSLVEVVVALLLLSGASLAVTSTLLAAQRSQRTAARWLEAVQLAADGVEQLRAGLVLAPVEAVGFERAGRVVVDPAQPGVGEVEVTVRWDDGGTREYRLTTTVLR